MKITIPELSLVVLIGASGAGKSSFAANHFKPTEVLSSDYFRGLMRDDENDMEATGDAFETLHFVARKRLAARRIVVVDATNVQPEARKPLVALARQMHVQPVAIVLNMPAKLCHERNQGRENRNFGTHVVRRQAQQLKRSLRNLKREGFRHIWIIDRPEDVDTVTIERQRLWTDRRDEHGPFDIIGDIHGCFDELVELLQKLGYEVTGLPDALVAHHPERRRVIFLGDLVDRGPNSPGVLRLVMNTVGAGDGICVPGNHDVKLLRKLNGRNVQLTHGLAETVAQMENESDAFKEQVAEFIDGLISHFMLDNGELVVAHAGMRESFQGRASGAVREFALYGETTGETDDYGLPVRYNWAGDYRGKAMVVYGHTPVPEANWLNRTICVDTGCVFGGKLTALRYPERELVDVPAHREYYEPIKPLAAETPGDGRPEEVLDIADITGKRIVSTTLHGNVSVREENAAAALEVMSRFAVDPRWLIYLPPTMSPSGTCETGEWLERPDEAFGYFRGEGVAKVVCEEKHMGSRAVIVLCRDADAARRRFGVDEERVGVVYSRTGRPFFSDATMEAAVLERLRAAMETAGLWQRLDTGWVCLDAELMPWSAKAQGLLQGQYASVGSAGRAAMDAAVSALGEAAARTDMEGDESAALLKRFTARRGRVERYVAAYRQYCWPVETISDLKIAPFHLMASEGGVHADQDHAWHMATLAELCAADPELLLATEHRVVELADTDSVAEAISWWEEITARGGEGMVVKPLDWIARGKRGLVQPAVKCRGREYLRIIYGPEYTAPDQIEMLRRRGLTHKRSMALREFALGMEALDRFCKHEPLYRVHECAFGVLALESEPVDPRL